MKMIRTMMTAGAIAGLVASTGAAAAEASHTANALKANGAVTTAQVRQSANVDKKSKLASGAIVPLVLAAGIVAGGVIIAVDDDDDTADSAG
ncbi:hypothetical protein [Stakelama saccharophila]|uniref:Secreted protein n=1 Tax=Stakelama saccharophila TaxID=3075605 RepID=A0ABZ0B832_9SPHN|nr:hypothetical protein [Stakelama sp. W311]WNO53018.1 hypothetical protein RPR59_11200 [Stakelama sp. W311]